MAMRGTYLEIVPNEKLAATERFDDSWNGSGGTSTLMFSESDSVTVAKQLIEYESTEIRDQVP